VIVEGIPGSGKTSTARFAAGRLARRGVPTRLHLEGDLDHPADYESTACLGAGAYTALRAAFPAWGAELDRLAFRRGEEVLLSYRRLDAPPAGLFAALASKDVYELPLADWQRVTLARWEEFSRAAAQGDDAYVFECCLLQNLLTTPLARFDQPEAQAAAHVLRAAGAISALRPALIYLDPPSVRAALEKAAAERPREWFDFVSAYTCGQAWGAARGLSGFEGLVRFYETRRALEKSLIPALAALGFDVLWLDNAGLDWDADHARVDAFLTPLFDLA
jgi:hypothetical protein